MKRNRFVFMDTAGGDGGAGGTGGSGGAPGGLPGGGQEGAPSIWYGGFQSAELRGVCENNGWKTPEDAVKNYAELSKVIGVPKDFLLKLPQKDDDAEGWGQVYDRLGRPKGAAEYGLDKLEGADPEFASLMAKAFYEAGAPKKLVDRVMGDYSGYAKSYFEKQGETARLATEADTSKLKAEWGEQYQATVERGGMAVKELWGDQADAVMDALQSKLGVYGAAKAIAKLADKAGEASFRQSGEGTGTSSGFGMSPDGARAEIARLKADPSFVQDMFSDNQQRATAARQKMNNLMRIANPGSVEGVGVSATR